MKHKIEKGIPNKIGEKEITDYYWENEDERPYLLHPPIVQTITDGHPDLEEKKKCIKVDIEGILHDEDSVNAVIKLLEKAKGDLW